MKLVKTEKKDRRSDLDKVYDDAVNLLKSYAPGTKEYEAQLKVVERLEELRVKEKTCKPQLSPDVIVSAACNLLISGAILQHEQLHNITSKALQFVTKGRLR